MRRWKIYAQNAALGRLGQPEEMADAICCLASSQGSCVTGFDLVADGGVSQL